MAGQLTIDTLKASSGVLATQNGMTGIAKAWVSFNGTTTPATINAAFNVSSVTHSSTGSYTVNFTTAMPDANYAVAWAAQPTVSNGGSDTFPINPTTTNVDVRHYEVNTLRDTNFGSVAIFR